jgi:hypothetical protein
VTLVAGELTAVTGTYAPMAGAPGADGFGLLRVTTSPPVPSQIVVDGVIRDTWGLTWVKLPPGTYTVEFGHVERWTAPDAQTVTVSEGAVTEVVGTFAQRGFLRVMTNPQVPATISVGGVPRNDWGMWTDLPPGTYQVCFGSAAGYFTPPCQTHTVTAGSTTSVTATYTARP